MESRYANAPLQEALIEVNFANDLEWDPALPGLLYSKIQDAYPERKSTTTVGVLIQQEGDDYTPTVERQLRSQFWNKEMNATVQVSPNQLVVNRLKPYTNWDEFLERFRKAYLIFLDLTEFKDVESIRVQCLNRPDFQIDSKSLKNFLTIGPCQIPESLCDFRSFLWGIELFRDDSSKIRVEAASYASSAASPFKIRLDLTFESTRRRSTEWTSVAKWLDVAHVELVSAFEASITDQSRKEFARP